MKKFWRKNLRSAISAGICSIWLLTNSPASGAADPLNFLQQPEFIFKHSIKEFIRLESFRLSPASIYVVNSTLDTPDAAPGNNSCSDAAGRCTLRAAIQEANAHAGADTINFSIAAGLQTITPAAALPNITDSVTIDGTTQPGYAGAPLIELSGAAAGGEALRFLLVGNSVVRGLIINRFRTAIYFDAPGTVGNNVVENCYIGTNSAGAAPLGNSDGIVLNSTNNRVGGLAVSQRNLISGNTGNGVQILGDNNLIQGNYIGTNAGGTAAIVGLLGANQFGLNVQSNSNVIGGSSPGARNIISGNAVGVILTAPAPLTASNNLIQGNYIGTDAGGAAAVGNYSGGVRLRSGATNNTVGGTAAAARNVISGNLAGGGISLEDAGTAGNFIQGNYIGTDASGANALGNVFGGIFVNHSASSNTIGGAATSAGNVISANQGDGIVILRGSADYLIQHNFIGTNAAGTAVLPNSLTGITISNVGAAVSTNVSIKNNLISGNSQAGIDVFNSNDNQIQGNRIGTDAGGTVDLGNGGAGIVLNGTASNSVGGNSAALTNLISGNNGDGVALSGANAQNNLISGNLIGTDITGNLDVGNGGNGVRINGAPSNTVGSAFAQNAVNTISGNDANGVLVVGADASGNRIVGNRIGTNSSGTAALQNAQIGVSVAGGASSNKIGDLTPTPGVAPGNLISGQTAATSGVGVRISGAGTRLNSVFGNLIGADASGTSAIPNGTGVSIDFGAAQNFIGEKVPNARNVISGNASVGVAIGGSGTNDNQVQNNLIGTDASGAGALGNSFAGVQIFNSAAGNMIGGTLAGSRNIISATKVFPGFPASGHGVRIFLNATGNFVQGNYIGTNAAGNAALPNAADGVKIEYASSNTIGGVQAGARNLISGNNTNGVSIDNNANHNQIQNNLIGFAADGATPLPNLSNGVQIDKTDAASTVPTGNTIGGAGAGEPNRIGYNKGRGVFILSGLKTSILSNSIFSNDNLGIDLFPNGATANDVCDADAGANNLQNFPIIETAANSGGTTIVTGTLKSAPSEDYTIQIYVNDSCDASGFGEGQTLLDSFTLTTDADCQKSFVKTFSPQIPNGKFITATATDAGGNTSEFSQCKFVGIPTAASASVSGRVTTADGRGIRNAYLILTDGSGAARYAHTLSRGAYRFDDLPTGETYVLTVFAKRFAFAQPTLILNLTEDLTDVNFTSAN